MSDPQTANKYLYVPAHGADVDAWDVPVNANWNGIDQALGKYTTLNANGLSGTIALTTSQTIPLGFIITGTPSGSVNYQVPAAQGGIWLVRNTATLGASITIGFSSASGGSTVTIPAGENLAISADGTANGMADIDTVPTTAAGGSNNQIQVNIAGVLGAYAGFTFDGSTFHTPQLTVDGNAIFGTGAGSTLTINGTAISAPNGFNFNAGAFQMNAGGMLGIGTAPTSALLTIGGQIAVTAGGFKYPDNTISTTANGKILQFVTKTISTASNVTGTIATGTGAAPTISSGVEIFSQSFTPVSGASMIAFEASVKGEPFGTDVFTIAIFNGSTLIDMQPLFMLSGGAVQGTNLMRTYLASPGTSAVTFSVRFGANSGTTFGINSYTSGGQQLGSICWFTITEIQPGGP